MYQQETIDRCIRKRQFAFIDQRNKRRSCRRPFDHALACRHEGKAALRILAKQAKIGCGVTDAEQPKSCAPAPQSANGEPDEPPCHGSERMSIEIAKIDDIHFVKIPRSAQRDRTAARRAASCYTVVVNEWCSMDNERIAPSNAQIRLFLCLKDNYGVLVHDPASGATAAIDAPEAAPVEAALRASGWRLSDILVTHHHGDHTAGIGELKKRHRARVVAPREEAAKIPDVDEAVAEGDTVAVGTLSARVIATPGHTLGQINYYFPTAKLLFAGDTLFSIGCGRVIEGTPEMMWQSLLKLRDLPDDTAMYCGHEYTDANIRFALTIEPDNPALAARAAQVKSQVAAGTPTIPTLMGEEKRANVFLRADDPAVASAVSLAGKPGAQVFAEVRARKNRF